MEDAPRFRIRFTPEAVDTIKRLKKSGSHQARVKKVEKALKNLAEHGPSYPGLRTHPYKSVLGPGDETVFQSYVENRTPGAWRMWWWYGPEDGEITILSVMKHP